MDKKGISVESFFAHVSIILIMIVVFARCYLVKFSGDSKLPIIVLFAAILFLLMSTVAKKRVYKRGMLFLVLLVFMFLPSLYKNAYVSSNNYSHFFYYLGSLIYVGLFYFKGFEEKYVKFIFKICVLFSIVTSIVTWIAYFSPSTYLTKFLPLLPESVQIDVKNLFLYENANPGLTDHYSRNAFYMLLGLLGCGYIFGNKDKRKPICIVFLLLSLFLVGKRAHIVFFTVSLIFTYFIYFKVSVSKVIKFIGIFIALLCMIIVSSRIIPGVNNFFYRMVNSNHNDITNGRIELYNKAFDMYRDNDSVPIGWGQLSKSTNYSYAGVHNDYIQLFIETGLVGFLLIVCSNIYILFKSIKLTSLYKNSLYFVILAYNIFYLLYSLTGIPHYDFEVYTIYLLLSSILFTKITERKKANEKIT